MSFGKAKGKVGSRSPCSSTESISLSSSNAIVKTTYQTPTTTKNFTSMVKKFMDKRSATTSKTTNLFIPHDFNKPHKKTSKFPNKLFGNGNKKEKAALTEVKPNTRSLAMVLKSERELLTANKDQDLLISQLQSMLQQRNLEVEKLKDLCLKQKEEIKALKSAVLFPEEMNMQLHHMLLDSNTNNLQTQISSLSHQLHTLSQDIAQVKAVTGSGTPCIQGSLNSPRTPIYDAANSLDFSDDEPATPDSSDDMLLKDVNPCLTPCYSKIKSKEYGAIVADYRTTQDMYQVRRDSHSAKGSRSSDHLIISRTASHTGIACTSFCRSDESKYRYGNPMEHQ